MFCGDDAKVSSRHEDRKPRSTGALQRNGYEQHPTAELMGVKGIDCKVIGKHTSRDRA